MPDCNQHFYIDKYRIKRKGGVLCLGAFPMRVTAAFEQVPNKQVEFGDRAKLLHGTSGTHPLKGGPVVLRMPVYLHFMLDYDYCPRTAAAAGWFASSTVNLGAQIAKDGAPNSIQGRHDAN